MEPTETLQRAGVVAIRSPTESTTPRLQRKTTKQVATLPRLSTGSMNSMASSQLQKKPKIMLETVIIPSKAVAQSMVSISTSCPDLTNKITGSGSPAQGSSNSDGPGRLVRCRIPLSVASSPRLSRKVGGFVQMTRQSIAERGSPKSSSAEESTDKRPYTSTTQGDNSPDGTPVLVRRRPATQESCVSNAISTCVEDSPGSPPTVGRRRRAGQYSLTAHNEIIVSDPTSGGGRPTCYTGLARVTRDRDSMYGSAAAVNNQRDNCGNQTNSNNSLPQNGTPPLTSRLSHGAQSQSQSPSQRQSGGTVGTGFKRPPLLKRLSTNSLPTSSGRSGLTYSNNQGGIGPTKKDGCQNKYTTSSDIVTSTQNISSSSAEEVKDDQELANQKADNNMAPETYQRCMRWIIDVESAKGDRSLDAIMLPPVQIFDKPIPM